MVTHLGIHVFYSSYKCKKLNYHINKYHQISTVSVTSLSGLGGLLIQEIR